MLIERVKVERDDGQEVFGVAEDGEIKRFFKSIAEANEFIEDRTIELNHQNIVPKVRFGKE